MGVDCSSSFAFPGVEITCSANYKSSPFGTLYQVTFCSSLNLSTGKENFIFIISGFSFLLIQFDYSSSIVQPGGQFHSQLQHKRFKVLWVERHEHLEHHQLNTNHGLWLYVLFFWCCCNLSLWVLTITIYFPSAKSQSHRPVVDELARYRFTQWHTNLLGQAGRVQLPGPLLALIQLEDHLKPACHWPVKESDGNHRRLETASQRACIRSRLHFVPGHSHRPVDISDNLLRFCQHVRSHFPHRYQLVRNAQRSLLGRDRSLPGFLSGSGRVFHRPRLAGQHVRFLVHVLLHEGAANSEPVELFERERCGGPGHG